MTLRLGRLTTSPAGNQQVEAVYLIVEIVFEGRLETSNLSQDGPTIVVRFDFVLMVFTLIRRSTTNIYLPNDKSQWVTC